MPYRNYPTEVFEDLRQMMRINAERFGERTLFVERVGEQSVRMGYRSLQNNVEALGSTLLVRGWNRKRVLLCAPSKAYWATAFLAVVCGLGVVIPVDPKLPAVEISALAKRTDADAVIAPKPLLEVLSKPFPSMRRVAFEDIPDLILEGERLLASGMESYRNIPIDRSAEAVTVSANVEGRGACAAMLSHQNLCFQISELCRMIEIRESDCFLSVLPLHYAYEMLCGLLLPMSCGASVAFGRGSRSLLQDLRTFSPTVVQGVPQLFQTLYERIWADLCRRGEAEKAKAFIKATDGIAADTVRERAKRRALSSLHQRLGGRLRLLISCKPVPDPSLLSGFRALGIAAIQGYWIHSCAAMAAINRDRFYNDRSAGLSLPHTLLDIHEAGESGRGEIRFQGDHLMLGYYKDPETTRAVLKNGWAYSGDVGYVDENGFLFVTGKSRNRIQAPSGTRLSPEELEERLDRRPYVRESFVMLGAHHKKKRDAVVAVVVPDLDKIAETYGSAFTRAQTEMEVRRAVAEVNATLPRDMRIESYRIRTEPFPRGHSKALLRRQIARDPLGD